MLQSTLSLSSMARFAVFLPFAILVAACSDGASTGATTGTGGANTTSTTGTTGNTGGGTGTAGGTGTGGDSGNPDTTAPAVTSTYPLDEATGVATILAISATFSEAMDPLTITGKSFTLKQGDVEIAGAVSYFNQTAIFLPSVSLALNTKFVATITTTATDLAGNALEMAHSWKFTTDVNVPIGPAPVILGAAGKYAILPNRRFRTCLPPRSQETSG